MAAIPFELVAPGVPGEVGVNRPLWPLANSVVDLDFANARYYGGTLANMLSTTRASVGYARTTAGLLLPFAVNVPRLTDLGLLIEEARTNVVLWCRDLTNAAWTKSNITAALNQVGADGSASSATSLTATAGNGTVLQAITLGSSARFQSAFVKRLVGTGNIQMTTDNGATWTNITTTAIYQQLSIPSQTLANPTVGFRIVTNGDSIAVDFVMNEGGTFQTSPILTTTVSVTRAADNITAAGALLGRFTPAQGSVFVQSVMPPEGTASRQLWTPSDAAGNEQIALRQVNASLPRLDVVQGGVNKVVAIGTIIAANAAVKMSAGWVSGDTASFSNNTTNSYSVGAQATTYSTPAITAIQIGGAPWYTGYWNNYVKRIAIWNSRLPDGVLKALTA